MDRSESMTEPALTEKKFAGIAVKPGLTRGNYFFLFLNTLLIGMFMSIPAVVQPAFMRDCIGIHPDFTGSVNSLLQNMSQIATLAFVALIGALSDKTGRKILIIIGFCMLFISFYLFQISSDIAAALGISAEAASRICALLSFAPGRAADFTEFAPGLLVAYCMRFMVGFSMILAYPQCITMMGDYTGSRDRGKGMAINGMAMGLAGICIYSIFPSIMNRSGVLAAINVAIMLAAFGALLSAVFLKDRMPAKTDKKNGLLSVMPALKKSAALRTSYLCALIMRADITVMGTYLLTWGVNAGLALGMDSGAAISLAKWPILIITITSLVCFPCIGILLDKKGRVFTLLLSISLSSVAMLLVAAAPDPFSPLCYIAATLAGFGISGSIAGANTLAIDASPPGMSGSVMGGLNTMQPIGIIFFLGLGGYLFDTIGPHTPFVLKGIAGLALGIWLYIKRNAVAGPALPAC